MKKFTFLLLGIIISGGHVCVANADSCQTTADGSGHVCGYRLPGGSPEQDKCKDEGKNSDYYVDWNIVGKLRKGGNFCTYYDAKKNILGFSDSKCGEGNPFNYRAKDASCTPSNAVSGYCFENGTLELEPKEAANMDLPESNEKVSIISCAAKECVDGYLLWTTNQKKRQEIPVVGTNKKVGSEGVCHSRQAIKDICEKSCECPTGFKCVLNEVTVKNHGKDISAYIGEEMCICKKVQNEDDGGDDTPTKPVKCKYKFNGDIKCANNNNAHIEKEFPITEAMLTKYSKTCDNMDINTAQDMLFDEEFSKDFKEVLKLYNELCSGNGNGGSVWKSPAPTGPSKTEVNNATNSMNVFFNSVNANRSVWKTVDGKFNTARLASDLTSAVVLGTVGGVVSGVVIKKKQVEKGFEVLHCKVGGQKIADWGDEFTVGFRK